MVKVRTMAKNRYSPSQTTILRQSIDLHPYVKSAALRDKGELDQYSQSMDDNVALDDK